MSYYGVSVLVTIIVTSLIAFYLLYKAKELNLGILISISIGSIILGFTFSPAFKTVLKVLSENININKKIALVISLLSVLFVFLVFILVISFVISICIPKRFTSIDCCVVIDQLLSKIKDRVISVKDKFIGFSEKIIINLKEIVKNVYNLKNMLKKPVDTKQIIDTMGIEKSKNGILEEESNNNINNQDSVPFANLLAYMEPSGGVAHTSQDYSSEVDIIAQELEDVEYSTYQDLAAVIYEDVVTIVSSDNETEKIDLSEVPVDLKEDDIVTDIELSEEIEQSEAVDTEVVKTEEVQNETVETEEAQNETVETEETQSETVETEKENNTVETEVAENEASDDKVIDANSLVLKAFESKDEGRKEEAIEHYIEALQHEPNNEMIFWIVLDVCALYKQLGLSELAKNILEGLVSQYGSAIQPEIKKEIMNNLK